MKTGRPVETDVSAKARAGEKVVVWPSILGGKNWEPMSFDPQNNTAYANTLNIGGHYKAVPGGIQSGRLVCRHGSERSVGVAAGSARLSQGDRPADRQDQVGKRKPTFRASPASCRPAAASSSPDQLTGEFEAFDADTGKKLWQFQTGSGIEGQPRDVGAGRRAVRCGGKRLRRRPTPCSPATRAGFGARRRIALGLCPRSAVKPDDGGRARKCAGFRHHPAGNIMKIYSTLIVAALAALRRAWQVPPRVKKTRAWGGAGGER